MSISVPIDRSLFTDPEILSLISFERTQGVADGAIDLDEYIVLQAEADALPPTLLPKLRAEFFAGREVLDLSFNSTAHRYELIAQDDTGEVRRFYPDVMGGWNAGVERSVIEGVRRFLTTPTAPDEAVDRFVEPAIEYLKEWDPELTVICSNLHDQLGHGASFQNPALIPAYGNLCPRVDNSFVDVYLPLVDPGFFEPGPDYFELTEAIRSNPQQVDRLLDLGETALAQLGDPQEIWHKWRRLRKVWIVLGDVDVGGERAAAFLRRSLRQCDRPGDQTLCLKPLDTESVYYRILILTALARRGVAVQGSIPWIHRVVTRDDWPATIPESDPLRTDLHLSDARRSAFHFLANLGMWNGTVQDTFHTVLYRPDSPERKVYDWDLWAITALHQLIRLAPRHPQAMAYLKQFFLYNSERFAPSVSDDAASDMLGARTTILIAVQNQRFSPADAWDFLMEGFRGGGVTATWSKEVLDHLLAHDPDFRAAAPDRFRDYARNPVPENFPLLH